MKVHLQRPDLSYQISDYGGDDIFRLLQNIPQPNSEKPYRAASELGSIPFVISGHTWRHCDTAVAFSIKNINLWKSSEGLVQLKCKYV